MARKRREKITINAPDKQLKGSLGDLLRAAGLEVSQGVEGTEAPPPPDAPKPAASPDDGGLTGRRLRLRRERKGRRGKEVTLVEGLEGLAADVLEGLAKRLRRKLGCGVSVEGERLVLQGDQRQRAASLLEVEGAKDVRAS